MFWEENIKKYIDINASPSEKQRGQIMHKSGAVFNVTYDPREDFGEVSVLGGGTLTVNVKNLFQSNYDNIEVQCECPHEDTKLCKHGVAALIALNQKMQYYSGVLAEKRPQVYQTHRSNFKFEISSKLLKEYKKKSNYSTDIINRAKEPIEYENLSAKQLSFIVKEKSHSWYTDYNKNFRVTFSLERKKLFSQCSCKDEVLKLCPHQERVLYHVFVTTNSPNLFDNLKNDRALRRQAREIYQIDSDDELDNYFELSIDDQGLSYTPKGINLISAKESQQLAERFLRIENTLQYIKPIEENTQEEVGQGIVFYFSERTEGTPIQTTLVEGRFNKSGDKIISHFIEKKVPNKLPDNLKDFYYRCKEAENQFKNDHTGQNIQHYIDIFSRFLPDFQNTTLLSSRDKRSIKKSDLRSIQILPDKVKLILHGEKDKYTYNISALYRTGDITYPLKEYNGIDNSVFLSYGENYMLIPNIRTSKLLAIFKKVPVLRYSLKSVKEFKEQLCLLSQQATVTIDKIAFDTYSLKASQMRIFLEESGDKMLLKPFVLYDNDKMYSCFLSTDPLFLDTDGQLQRVFRDHEYEDNFIALLSDFDPAFAQQRSSGIFYKDYKAITNSIWIFDLYSFCKKHDIGIYGMEKLKKLKYTPQAPKVNMSVSSGIDWFEGNVRITYGEKEASLRSVKEAILKGEKFVRLNDGSLGKMPEEWASKLENLFRAGQIQGEKVLISKLKFNLIDSLFDEIDDETLAKDIAEKRQKLLSFEEIKEIDVPDTIQATLRPYQIRGFHWLKFLDEFKFGGILADDMGLGKTLQVITFLAYIGKYSDHPSLVVAPRSLLFNWTDEIDKFCPSLKYLVYHGPKRAESVPYIQESDIIISTYGTITNDITFFRRLPLHYVILDESQAIKNPNSKRYKAMRLLESDNRIVMTGTPIENHTFDLYAQFNFLNPGFLGSQKHFRTMYSEPIDGAGNEVVSAELRKIVFPFMLRRTKQQVAKELPPKTESVIYCEMHEEQRNIYNLFLARYRDYVQQKMDSEGIQRSKMYVIEGLLKLRQICNSPSLLNEDITYPNISSKIDSLMAHLADLTGHHKVLVISQFTSMLALIRERIEKEKTPYTYLDGKTTKRKEIVDEFNNNENKRIFLISLKAGGLGLNLTSADYVFLVDPWWNPAVETQAIDRTYRIGQDKHVFAYRLICKDSIEEKIQKLQRRKKNVADDIIKAEDSFIKSLKKEDIMALFS